MGLFILVKSEISLLHIGPLSCTIRYDKCIVVDFINPILKPDTFWTSDMAVGILQ